MITAYAAGREIDFREGFDALLTITIDEDATVFSGLSNVHRYDRPSASEIVSFVRGVLGDDPQQTTVHLVADAETQQRIIHAFGDYGIDLTCEDPSSSGQGDGEEAGAPSRETVARTHPATSEWEEINHIPVRRPAVETRRTGRLGSVSYLLAGVVVLVAAVCGVAIWVVAGRGVSNDVHDAAEQPSQTTPLEAHGSRSPSHVPEQPGLEPEQPAPENVTLEQNGLSVELPVGFHLEPDGNMWRATGPDPDFRLQLAVDPLYGVAPDAVMRQVLADIEADPELRLIDSSDENVRYAHDLPDGSRAQWSTWTDRDVQLSIGCHTRKEPTTVQSATCTMANDSARFTPPE